MKGEALVDLRFEQALQVGGRPRLTPEYDVTGLEERSHVTKPELGEDLPQVVHRDFLVAAEIDASEERDDHRQWVGRWLAYQSNESGKSEVYVRAFATSASGPGAKWQISNSGGVTPRWSRSGPELVYQSGDQVMAARYTVHGDTFVAEKPRVWIAKLGGTLFDVAPDGRRVAVLVPVASADAPKQEHEVVLLLNFFDELRWRAPVNH